MRPLPVEEAEGFNSCPHTRANLLTAQTPYSGKVSIHALIRGLTYVTAKDLMDKGFQFMPSYEG